MLKYNLPEEKSLKEGLEEDITIDVSPQSDLNNEKK